MTQRILALLGLLVLASPATAAPSCADLAAKAGERFGLPDGLLPAISLVETGRDGQSWPWTLNEGGKGMHFDTKAEALGYLQDAVARGVTNIDVGCMQLNYRWHADAFGSLDQMLDPAANTAYAAMFVVELKNRLGSWEDATAHYHSSDADRGARYLSKVVQASGRPLPDAPAADLATGHTTASGTATGLLLVGGALLGDKPTAGKFADTLARAADEAARAPARPLRTQSELPPRLGQRWQAILAAREHLSIAP